MKIKYRGAFGFVSGLEKMLGVLLKLVVFPVVLIAAYALYDFCMTELDAERSGKLAAAFVKENDSEQAAEVDFMALKEKNPEIIAWLRIPDTKIDFPVMHARDNKFYLSHDYEKKFAITGGGFLDYRNDANLRDDFSIIYGHRMSSGRMFSDIGKFKDKEFFDAHTRALLYTPDRNYILHIVAFASVAGDDSAIYGFDYYTKEESLKKIEENAINQRGAFVGRPENFVLLSTCSIESEGVRDVVLGYLE
jgi:sortase B